MSDKDITLDDYYDVTDHLPYGWSLILTSSQQEANLKLESPDGEDVDFDFGDTMIWSARNAVDVARAKEGEPVIDWNGMLTS